MKTFQPKRLHFFTCMETAQAQRNVKRNKKTYFLLFSLVVFILWESYTDQSHKQQSKWVINFGSFSLLDLLDFL